MFNFFKTPCKIGIKLSDEDARPKFALHKDEGIVNLPFLCDDESIKGNVSIEVLSGRKVEHTGIKVELIGQIENFWDRGRHYSFLSLTKELAQAGELNQSVAYPFEFDNVQKEYDSYNGINVRLRYLIRATIIRNLSTNIIQDYELWVHTQSQPSSIEIPNNIKMEVGIEDALHIEFEYDKARYHLKDVVVGKIFFLLVRVKIKHMELQLVRKEIAGTGNSVHNENEILSKFEIMDGVPVKGESIPVRMFLGPYDLTPTYRSIHSKFSVRYFINLILIDEEDRRYFKQQEIILYRKPIKKSKRKTTTQKLNNHHNQTKTTTALDDQTIQTTEEAKEGQFVKEPQ